MAIRGDTAKGTGLVPMMSWTAATFVSFGIRILERRKVFNGQVDCDGWRGRRGKTAAFISVKERVSV